MNCIESITEGQQVVLDSGYNGAGRYSTGTVTRISKTQITIEVNGKARRYNKRNGVEIGYGDSWRNRPRIATKYNDRAPESLLPVEEAEQWESEAALEDKKRRLARAIRDVPTSKFLALSLEELQAIADKIGVEK